MLGYVVNLCLTFKETDKLLQLALSSQPAMHQGFGLCRSLPTFARVCLFFCHCHCGGYEQFLSVSSDKLLKPV